MASSIVPSPIYGTPLPEKERRMRGKYNGNERLRRCSFLQFSRIHKRKTGSTLGSRPSYLALFEAGGKSGIASFVLSVRNAYNTKGGVASPFPRKSKVMGRSESKLSLVLLSLTCYALQTKKERWTHGSIGKSGLKVFLVVPSSDIGWKLSVGAREVIEQARVCIIFHSISSCSHPRFSGWLDS